jgi:hypothetical protein
MRIQAVYGFRKNAGTSGLAHTARTTEQIGAGQFVTGNGTLQCICQSPLAHNVVKRLWTVFASGYDKILHFLFSYYCAKL